MPYILPKGTYYDATDHVAEGSVKCAKRPAGMVLAENWRDDPMDSSICFREKTQAELDAEIQLEEDEMIFPDVIKMIAKGLHNHENRIRALEGKQPVSLRQVIKALRAL